MKEKIGACCVILNEKNEVLVLHRNTEKWQHYELPGGKKDEGETLEQAAKREAWEETSLVVEVGEELGEISFTDDDTNFEFHWFLATIVSGTPAIPEKEEKTFDEITYLSWEEMQKPGMSLSKNLQGVLAEYLKGNTKLHVA